MNPSNPYEKVALCLSSEGNNIFLRKDNINFMPVNLAEGNFHPNLIHASTLKTHFAVFNFLVNIQKDKDCLDSVDFYHRHNVNVRDHFNVLDYLIKKILIHKCPIEKMIDFVKNQIKIMDLKSIEEVNQYLDVNPPQTALSVSGNYILKFVKDSIPLNELIEFIKDLITISPSSINRDSCDTLIKKMISYHDVLHEQSKRINFTARKVTQKNDQDFQALLNEITLTLGATVMKRAELGR